MCQVSYWKKKPGVFAYVVFIRDCFPPLGRREALEERVDVKYFLLWIHHQGSGRCPYKNSAHTCEHSNTPVERWHFHRLVWVYSEPDVF